MTWLILQLTVESMWTYSLCILKAGNAPVKERKRKNTSWRKQKKVYKTLFKLGNYILLVPLTFRFISDFKEKMFNCWVSKCILSVHNSPYCHFAMFFLFYTYNIHCMSVRFGREREILPLLHFLRFLKNNIQPNHQLIKIIIHEWQNIPKIVKAVKCKPRPSSAVASCIFVCWLNRQCWTRPPRQREEKVCGERCLTKFRGQTRTATGPPSGYIKCTQLGQHVINHTITAGVFKVLQQSFKFSSFTRSKFI